MAMKPTENEELDQLISVLGFTDLQKRLVKSARVAEDSKINRSKMIGEIYFANRTEELFDRMIASNEKLAESNDRFSKAANWMTAGLLILTVVQIVIQIVVPLI